MSGQSRPTVEIFEMRLYKVLRRNGVNNALAEKACRCGISAKSVGPRSWKVFNRSYMMEIGLSAEESLVVMHALDVEFESQQPEPARMRSSLQTE
jgi:hypothetical protein